MHSMPSMLCFVPGKTNLPVMYSRVLSEQQRNTGCSFMRSVDTGGRARTVHVPDSARRLLVRAPVQRRSR